MNEAYVKFFYPDGTWFKKSFGYEDNEDICARIMKYAKDYNLTYQYIYFTK